MPIPLKLSEYWARIGKLVEDNPDLPYSFLLDVQVGIEEDKAGLGTEMNYYDIVTTNIAKGV